MLTSPDVPIFEREEVKIVEPEDIPDDTLLVLISTDPLVPCCPAPDDTKTAPPVDVPEKPAVMIPCPPESMLLATSI